MRQDSKYIYSDGTYGDELNGEVIGILVIPSSHMEDDLPRYVSVKDLKSEAATCVSGVSGEYQWGDGSKNLSCLELLPNNVVTPNGEVRIGTDGFLMSDKFGGGYNTSSAYANDTRKIPHPYSGDYHLEDCESAVADMSGVYNTKGMQWIGLKCAVDCAYKNFSDVEFYIPSMGELGYLFLRFNEFNEHLKMIPDSNLLTEQGCYWSSTPSTNREAWALGTYTGMAMTFSQSCKFKVRPFIVKDELLF